MEIERRWLVEGWPALAPSSVLQMDQGYFAVRPAIRIRRAAAWRPKPEWRRGLSLILSLLLILFLFTGGWAG